MTLNFEPLSFENGVITQPEIVRFCWNFVRLWPRDTRCTINVQGQRVIGQDHSVTGVSASKPIVTYHEQIGLMSFNLVKSYPRAQRNMWHMFKVVRSNIQITIANDSRRASKQKVDILNIRLIKLILGVYHFSLVSYRICFSVLVIYAKLSTSRGWLSKIEYWLWCCLHTLPNFKHMEQN